MPAYKGTKELPNASNKQERDMFTSMWRDRQNMEGGRPDSVQRGERGEMGVLKSKPKPKKFAKGGVTKEMPTANQMGSMNMKKGGKVKKMAFGGSAFGSSGGRAGVSPRTAAANQAQQVQTMQSLQGIGNPGMKKGGKVKPAGKSDKAGRALVKKSADTMGRAMKFAKGGSIDGCAKKGKTKTTMVKMARGGKMKKGC